MYETAKFLRIALSERNWSITEAALKIGVDRSFLSRVLSGKYLPRKLKGSRSIGEPDERYKRIATALKLDEKEFLGTVTREQQSRSSRLRRKPKAARVPSEETSIVNQIKADYKKFHNAFAVIGEMDGPAALLNLAEECLGTLRPRDVAERWKERLRQSPRLTNASFFFEHDHIGTRARALGCISCWSRPQICQRIAEELTDDMSPDAKESDNGETAGVRGEIARMFIELSHALQER